jgi:hypothetical protein
VYPFGRRSSDLGSPVTYGNLKIVGYWVRVRVGDAPPPAVPPADGAPRWVRAGARAPRASVSASPDPVTSSSEAETRETWLVDSFEIVVPRYPWQKPTDTGRH